MPSKPDSFLRLVFPTSHRLLLNHLLKRFSSSVDGKVLVIGAGQVDYKLLLPCASSVLSTDIELYNNVDCVANILNLPFTDNSFDSILLIEVLEHVPDLNLAVSELYRVLRPRGLCLVSIPFLFRIHADPYDYHRLTRAGLINLFSFGFNIQLFPFGSRCHVISDLITTSHRFLVVLRPINYLLSLFFRYSSSDAPSGYFLKLVKHYD